MHQKKWGAAESTIKNAAILISYPKKHDNMRERLKGASEARIYKKMKYSFYQNTEDSFLFFLNVLEDNWMSDPEIRNMAMTSSDTLH